jgi:hypothetical protein
VYEPSAEEPKVETFVWRKKHQQIGLDKIDTKDIFNMNKLKQEETAVSRLRKIIRLYDAFFC